MRAIGLWVLIAACSAGAQPSLIVRTEPRVELMSIVYHLSGAEIYNQNRLPSYAHEVDSSFAAFRDAPVVRRAHLYEDSLGIGFDRPMELAERLTDARMVRPIVPIDTPDPEWGWPAGAAQPFLTDLRSFVHAAPLAPFFRAHAAIYDTATRRMRRLVTMSLDLGWFAHYFGHQPAKPFVLVPALLNGGANYGIRARQSDGTWQNYAIIGAEKVDGAGWPVFDSTFMPTIVHEFNHSYVNPVIDAHRAEFEAVGPVVLAAVRQQMKEQAYDDWIAVIYESVVRVSVARYRLGHGGSAAGLAEVVDARDKGFLWMPDLYALFGEYEGDRARYPDLASFIPRIVDFWRALPARLPSLVAQFDSLRPRVASTTPVDGDTAVDPAATTLVIRFDQPMQQHWGLDRLPDDTTVQWPVSDGRLSYDVSHTKLTVPVRLAARQAYAVVLNRAFKSQNGGIPLARTVIKFRTR